MSAAFPAITSVGGWMFAGLPVRSWAFAIRIWLALVLALYVSFWLELESPFSAALTVAILALPTRGQGMEKAFFRLVATVVGVAASIAIVGLFAQTGGLLLAAFGAWIGLCVYVAGLLDGNRAYAAALGVITVALIAIMQIDTPQQVFESGLARGAAIGVGVLTVLFVNDFLAAPDYYPKITAQLEDLHRRVVEYGHSAIRGQPTTSITAAALLREITVLRPEIASLAAESSNGRARNAAARSTMVGLVAELSAARALELLPVATAPGPRKQTASELDSGVMPAPSSRSVPRDQGGNSSGPMATSLTWLTEALLQKNEGVQRSLDAMRAGVFPTHEWRAPLYRAHRIAAETGVRATIYFALASMLFVMAGWPTTELSLALIAILIGLGATAPDAHAFAKLAVVSTPIACLLTGILEFVILDGVTEFPLLAIGMAPFVIGTALLMTLPNPMLSSLGRLNLIFILAVFSPSNPQTYDPQVYLIACLLICLAAFLLFAIQLLLPPLSNDSRIRRLLGSAHRDLSRLDLHGDRRLAPEETTFRDATRIGLIVAAGGTSPANRQALDDAMRWFDQTAALRLSGAELDRLADGPLADAADAARTSLATRNGSAIMASANALRDAASQLGLTANSACAALVLAGVAFTPVWSTTGSIGESKP